MMKMEVTYLPFERWPYIITDRHKGVKLTRNQAVVLLVMYHWRRRHHEDIPIHEFLRMTELSESTIRKCLESLEKKDIIEIRGVVKKKASFTAWGIRVAKALYNHEKERGALHGF